MDFFKDVVITSIPVIFGPLLGYVVWLLKEQRNENKETNEKMQALYKAMNEGMKEMLGYMVDRLYNEAMVQKYITTDQSDRLESYYGVYSALHGNGTRKHKYEEMKKLPIDDSKEFDNYFMEMYKEIMKGRKDNNE